MSSRLKPAPQGPAVPTGIPPEVMTGVQLRAWEVWTALPLRAREIGSLSHITKDSPHTQTPEQHSTLTDPQCLGSLSLSATQF